MVFGTDGNLYVASAASGEVLRYSAVDGSFIDVFHHGSAQPRRHCRPRERGSAGGGSGQSVARAHRWRRRIDPGQLHQLRRWSAHHSDCRDTKAEPATILVTIFDDNSVAELDGTTGTYLGDFIAPGSGGLSNPNGIITGPDGELWVSSYGNESVRRYDGLTGAYLDAPFTWVGPAGPSPADLCAGPSGRGDRPTRLQT